MNMKNITKQFNRIEFIEKQIEIAKQLQAENWVWNDARPMDYKSILADLEDELRKQKKLEKEWE
jgi:hypothetical protein